MRPARRSGQVAGFRRASRRLSSTHHHRRRRNADHPPDTWPKTRPEPRPPREGGPMRLDPSVRAVILDGDRLLLFRRTVPGRPRYWSIPGGHIEREDASMEHTLHREMLEELG